MPQVQAMSQPRIQCKACPWKVSTDPYDIPDGYDEDLHRSLTSTIAEPESLAGLSRPLRQMACHETMPGRELPCVGWLSHQIGEGNNLALRLAVMTGKIDANVKTVGPQHQRFEDTLP